MIEGSVTTAVFEASIAQVVCPTLHPGDLVILDNLAAHHASTIDTLIRAKGAQLLFLPAYSPDFSPIENAFSKIKHFLRQARAQTLETLIDAIDQALQTITPFDALGFFTNAGLLNLD